MRTAGALGIRAGIVVTAIVFLSIGRAGADPILAISGTVSESYNDNAGLTEGGPQGRDWITAITPGINVNEQGRRVQFNLNYTPTELIFMGGGSPLTELRQNLASSGQVELLQGLFFLDEQASISQQFINGAGPVGPTTYTTNSNLQTIEDYTLTAILRHDFGDVTHAETNFHYGQFIATGNTLAPLESEELRQTLNSGNYFGPLGWTLTGDAVRDRISAIPGEVTGVASGMLKDNLVRADLRYKILPELAVTGSGGYEQLSFPSLASTSSVPSIASSANFLTVGASPGSVIRSLKGPNWNAGFTYTPDSNFSLIATYGSRYNAPDYEVSAIYNGALTRATLTYSETIETASMLLLSNLGQLGFSNGLPINNITNLPFTGGLGYGNIPGLPFATTNSTFLGKFLNASLGTTLNRDTFTAYGSYGTENIYGPAITQRFYTVSLGWDHQLARDLTSHFSGTYGRSNFGISDEYQRNYSLLGSLSYTLSNRSALGFSVAIFDEQSNISSYDIKDDVVTVSYTRRF